MAEMQTTSEVKKERKKAEFSPNVIGGRGEFIFASRITQGFKFSVTFLGEKHDATDFCIEFKDGKDTRMAYVQVKSTDKAPSKKDTLTIHLTKKDVETIVAYPYPTYLAGVEIKTEKVYLMGLFQQKEAISSMPKTHVLSFGSSVNSKEYQQSADLLDMLKEDIKACWAELNPDKTKKSTYNSKIA